MTVTTENPMTGIALRILSGVLFAANAWFAHRDDHPGGRAEDVPPFWPALLPQPFPPRPQVCPSVSMSRPRCSRVMIVKTIAATAVAPVATARTTAVVRVPVVAAPVVVPRVPMAPRLTAATSLPWPQVLAMPSAFARPLRLPTRKENKHAAT